MRKALLLAVFATMFACTSRAQTTYQAQSANDTSAYGAMFHFDVNGEPIAVLFVCDAAPHIQVNTPEGVSVTQDVTCSDQHSTANGLNYSQVSFSATSVTVGSQTIQINPASFTLKQVTVGNGRKVWELYGGMGGVSITLD